MRRDILCAIDRPDIDSALALVRAVRGFVAGVKLGLEFFTANGPRGVREISDAGLPVFLDLKFLDIPATVAGAVRAAISLGPCMLTVHASGGPEMLHTAGTARRSALTWVLGVTVLTSQREAPNAVELAADCLAAGLDGVVCSPHEITAMRSNFGSRLKLIVPGIRNDGDAPNDQKRTMTAQAARKLGADYLVIGRPITAAADPAAALRAYV